MNETKCCKMKVFLNSFLNVSDITGPLPMLRAAPFLRFPNPDRFRPELRLPTTANSDLRNLVLKIGPIWSSRLPIPSPSLTSVTSFKRFPIQKTNSFSFRPRKVLGLQYSLASFMFTKTFNPEKPKFIRLFLSIWP